MPSGSKTKPRTCSGRCQPTLGGACAARPPSRLRPVLPPAQRVHPTTRLDERGRAPGGPGPVAPLVAQRLHHVKLRPEARHQHFCRLWRLQRSWGLWLLKRVDDAAACRELHYCKAAFPQLVTQREAVPRANIVALHAIQQARCHRRQLSAWGQRSRCGSLVNVHRSGQRNIAGISHRGRLRGTCRGCRARGEAKALRS